MSVYGKVNFMEEACDPLGKMLPNMHYGFLSGLHSEYFGVFSKRILQKQCFVHGFRIFRASLHYVQS